MKVNWLHNRCNKNFLACSKIQLRVTFSKRALLHWWWYKIDTIKFYFETSWEEVQNVWGKWCGGSSYWYADWYFNGLENDLCYVFICSTRCSKFIYLSCLWDDLQKWFVILYSYLTSTNKGRSFYSKKNSILSQLCVLPNFGNFY